MRRLALVLMFAFWWLLTTAQRARWRRIWAASRYLDRDLICNLEKVLLHYEWPGLVVRSTVCGRFPPLDGPGVKCLRDVPIDDDDWWKAFSVETGP